MRHLPEFGKEELGQPLDVVEHVIFGREYPYERPISDELVSEVLCSWCDVRVWCSWRPDLEMLVFSWGFGTKVPEYMRPNIYALLALVNERVMLGHFDLSQEEGLISFRHSMLLAGARELTSQQVEHLFDWALKECERFYPALQSVLWANKSPADAVAAAIFDTIGEA